MKYRIKKVTNKKGQCLYQIERRMFFITWWHIYDYQIGKYIQSEYTSLSNCQQIIKTLLYREENEIKEVREAKTAKTEIIPYNPKEK